MIINLISFYKKKIIIDKFVVFHFYSFQGMVFILAEGGIDKTPKNARIPDNISLILSLYDSLP